MPEGDTVWQTAKALSDALAGQVLTGCDIRVPRYATVDLSGQTVDDVVSRGKHLLIRIGEHSIHTHLLMEGAWHVYPTGTRWRRPAHQARIVLTTEHSVAVGFSLGITEVIATVDEDQVVGHLGPDLLGPDWDAGVAVRNLEAAGHQAIGIALLDQRNLAGLGNVYCNELCFLRGVDPRTPTRDVANLPRMVDLAHRTITANRSRIARTTTGHARPGQRLWVYERAGKPCRRCSVVIESAMVGVDDATARPIYVCPHCQTGVVSDGRTGWPRPPE